MFKYEKIETKDLILKPIELEDYKGLHKNFYTDKISASFMLWKASETLKDSKLFVQEELDKVKQGNFFSYAMLLKLNREIIGRIHFMISSENSNIIKSIGLGLGQKFTGKGYGTQALSAIVDVCFNDLNIKEINTSYFPKNTASKKLQEKLGFSEKGKLFELERKHTGEIEKCQPMILTKETWINKK